MRMRRRKRERIKRKDNRMSPKNKINQAIRSTIRPLLNIKKTPNSSSNSNSKASFYQEIKRKLLSINNNPKSTSPNT